LRIGRPRTLLSLALMGLGLVTLPLLYAVAVAVFELDDLMNESLEVARASEVTAREGQRIETALDNMLRHAQQFFALERDPARLELYLGEAQTLAAGLDALAAEPHLPSLDRDFERVEALLESVESGLLDPASLEATVLANLSTLAAQSRDLADDMHSAFTARRVGLEVDTIATQRALAWQAATLIPAALILALVLFLLVARPIRQIDRAIRELGEGDFSRPIAVTGPGDIETLGKQLEWLRVKLAESSEEKNRFLRHMSHELKTPLANIREGTDLLLDGSVGALDRQQQEVADILRENGIKLQRLIENLLTFSTWQSRTASLEITRFELKPLIFATLSRHRLTIANHGIGLELDIQPVGVTADEDKIRLVLENLVSNAVKFTPDEGTIAIRARMEGGELVLEVADSGPGVADEDRERLFEAFYQGQQAQGGPVGGTGIGLSVVSECVQAHGGSIELKAPWDSDFCGAHFVVRLPLRRADDRPYLAVANG
jgi:two-component system sensor histidine kinase GlrK